MWRQYQQQDFALHQLWLAPHIWLFEVRYDALLADHVQRSPAAICLTLIIQLRTKHKVWNRWIREGRVLACLMSKSQLSIIAWFRIHHLLRISAKVRMCHSCCYQLPWASVNTKHMMWCWSWFFALNLALQNLCRRCFCFGWFSLIFSKSEKNVTWQNPISSKAVDRGLVLFYCFLVAWWLNVHVLRKIDALASCAGFFF